MISDRNAVTEVCGRGGETSDKQYERSDDQRFMDFGDKEQLKPGNSKQS